MTSFNAVKHFGKMSSLAAMDVEQLKRKRVRISNGYILYLLLKSYFEVKVLKTT